MKLHEYQDDFKDLILATSQALGIREIYIEKDYWVTLALKNLANSKYVDVTVFKGGTSLSKALHVIERFSEDIDLALVPNEDLSGNQIKKLITNIQKTVAFKIKSLQNLNKLIYKKQFKLKRKYLSSDISKMSDE